MRTPVLVLNLQQANLLYIALSHHLGLTSSRTRLRPKQCTELTSIGWFCAGERLVEELAPELVPMLASLQMPANFVPMTNTVLAEMARRGITRDKVRWHSQ